MQIQWSLTLVERLRVFRNLGSRQFTDPCSGLARNFHRELGFDCADFYMLCSLVFNLPLLPTQ